MTRSRQISNLEASGLRYRAYIVHQRCGDQSIGKGASAEPDCRSREKRTDFSDVVDERELCSDSV